MTTPLPYRSHDHQACISQAMTDAHRICQEQGARMTRLREQVLSLVWQSHRPLGAYDILGSLNAEGRKAAPDRLPDPGFSAADGAGASHRIAQRLCRL